MGITSKTIDELTKILAEDGFKNIALKSPITETRYLKFRLSDIPERIEEGRADSWLEVLKIACTHLLEYCQDNSLTATFNPREYSFHIKPKGK